MLHKRPGKSFTGRRLAVTLVSTAVAALAAPGLSGAAVTSSGGVVAAGTPTVAGVVCLTQCVSARKATPGATVKVRGEELDYVRKVVFRGSEGPIPVSTTFRESDRVKTRVPSGAISSRPYVVDFRGTRSNPSPNVIQVLPVTAIPKEVFPVRGRHDYGSSSARFGAGRSGHSHQGQDVMAACGTRLVSAVAGKVEYRAYQGSAGNYVVIDSKGSNVDLVYMHLQRPGIVRPGQRVAAGQPIGAVGETGNAQGCHLHFEYWVGDWYGGGHPVDPYRFLKAWDAKS